MHVNKLTIGEFLPKKLGLKKNVINAPKANVTRNAMLTKTETPFVLENGFAPNNKFPIRADLFESKYANETSLLEMPLSGFNFKC
ncbi:TPA: hypothetical protein CPU00_10740 [Candidatus Gastranaerophilales bacterium HUM_18]|nr:MAG TPA: hypothetical protein CPU00_10740 [Candidatus Gastranaerophilales bacterium HUM_18]